MINFDSYTNKNKTEHNLKWSYIPDHLYRILIVGGSGSEKTNALINLLSNQSDINKIYLYAKDPYEATYQYLINKRKKGKAFMEYSNDKKDVYKKIEEYNPNKERKVLILLDDMNVDMINNKKLNPIATELFIRGRILLLPLLHNLILKYQKMLD